MALAPDRRRSAQANATDQRPAQRVRCIAMLAPAPRPSAGEPQHRHRREPGQHQDDRGPEEAQDRHADAMIPRQADSSGGQGRAGGEVGRGGEANDEPEMRERPPPPRDSGDDTSDASTG